MGMTVRGSIVLIVALALASCGGEGESGSKQQQPIPVTISSPTVKEVLLWDNFVGRFEALERVELRPRVSGYLQEIHFEDGAMVEEGEHLFTIDQRPFQATVDQARANLQQVETSLRLAEAELVRAKQLLDARAGSREEFDRALQARDASLANRAAAEAALREAELNLGFTEIRAPISGRLSRRFVDRGNLLGAGETVLTTIVSVDPIHFTFTGAESAYIRYLKLDEQGARPSSRVAPNPVRIRIQGSEDFDIEGTMDFVDNEINANTGTIVGRALIENPDGFLAPGMFGELRLYGRDPFEATMIPDSAIQFDQSREFVWVRDENGLAAIRPIKTGRLIEDNMRIIESGLAPDDTFVAAGFSILRPGMPIVDKSTMQRPGDGGAPGQGAGAAGGTAP